MLGGALRDALLHVALAQALDEPAARIRLAGDAAQVTLEAEPHVPWRIWSTESQVLPSTTSR